MIKSEERRMENGEGRNRETEGRKDAGNMKEEMNRRARKREKGTNREMKG